MVRRKDAQGRLDRRTVPPSLAAAVFCFFSLNRSAIGLRYVLPIYPFLFVFASGATRLFTSFKPKKLSVALLAGLVIWYVGDSCRIHPHYLAYFNELAGGPDNGYNCLVDSNLDWGQDLKGLHAYMREHGISRISLSYFGSDAPERYGIVYDWLPGTKFSKSAPQIPNAPPAEWIAISATNLQGVYLQDKAMYQWFRKQKPTAKIGYSIFVYHMNSMHE